MDWILRNATVIDGSGQPGRRSSVGIEGERIAAVGDIGEDADAEDVDLEGLVLSPGFIDIHTHYDAQNLWDPDLTSSFWHGVTTVVMGNCGFGIAPTRPEHRDLITRTLENVEGMSADSLQIGIPWEFETFDSYVALVEGRPKRINIGAMIGHTPLRLYVMGERADEREATPDETEQMRGIVADAMDAGALGFATSKSPSHNGAWGRPVPSRAASLDEITALADVLGESGRGVLQATYGPELQMGEFASLSERIDRPVSWTGLLTSMQDYGADLTGMEELAGRTPIEVLDHQAELPGEVWPQIACRPLVTQMTLATPSGSLARLATFKEVLAVPVAERAAIYADPDWRERARPEVHRVWSRTRWSKISIHETARHQAQRNIPLDQLADQQGVDPFDLLLDVALEDDLTTRFRVVVLNDDEVQLAELLRDGRALLGLSDAGAHVSQLYDACFSTHLLGYWVREKSALSLEQAVWRLTTHPADVFGIPQRGRIQPGYMADLVAFDPDTVGVLEAERVHDLPGGADRLIAPSVGIEHIWVNGHRARRDGSDVDDVRAGAFVRPDRP